MTEGAQGQDIIYSLAASPNYAQDGICFSARASGLYRSADGGHTWQYAYGSVGRGTDQVQHYCGVFDYFDDDPVWNVIKAVQ